MKPRGKPIYSVNEGNACLFDDAVTKYLESIKFPKVSTSVFFLFLFACFCFGVVFFKSCINRMLRVTLFNERKLFCSLNSL